MPTAAARRKMRAMHRPRLALFDLDHTLLPIDSADAWAHFVVRLAADAGGLDASDYDARIREYARTYHAGTFDVDGYVSFQMHLLTLAPRATLDDWQRQFLARHVFPHVRPEALALVQSHRQRGDSLALVTGTNSYVVTPIARAFGIEHVLALQPEELAGEFSGGRVGGHSYLQGKVDKVDEWLTARKRSWEDTATTYYGDSINDLPLLERVDEPVVTNGDAKLRAIARQRGWRTLQLFEQAAA